MIRNKYNKNMRKIREFVRKKLKECGVFYIAFNFRNLFRTNFYTETPRLFNVVFIETINRCNGICPFCPVNIRDDTREYKKMNMDLFIKIINDLKEIRFSGKLDLASNNEPFLDERLETFAEIARKNLPFAYIYLYTNGTLLTLDRFKRIIPFLDRIIIDNYNDSLELNKPIQIIYDYCKDDPMLNTKVEIRLRKVNEILTTRGGQSPNNSKKEIIPVKCHLPWQQFVITPDGRVSLCCNDALGKYTLGDVNNHSLIEIWHSEEYKNIRNLLKKGRMEVDLCKYCDSLHSL